MCSRCEQPVHRKKLCYEHWKELRRSRYHCTWQTCNNPIFALTLCRHHYRAANVECNVERCRRHVFCKQVCSYHYRKGNIPPLKKCVLCKQNVYMNGKCFYHFIHRTCMKCDRPSFAKQLCKRHYMRNWRSQVLRRTGPIANNETTPDRTHTTPETINQSPEIHSAG